MRKRYLEWRKEQLRKKVAKAKDDLKKVLIELGEIRG